MNPVAARQKPKLAGLQILQRDAASAGLDAFKAAHEVLVKEGAIPAKAAG